MNFPERLAVTPPVLRDCGGGTALPRPPAVLPAPAGKISRVPSAAHPDGGVMHSMVNDQVPAVVREAIAAANAHD